MISKAKCLPDFGPRSTCRSASKFLELWTASKIRFSFLVLDSKTVVLPVVWSALTVLAAKPRQRTNSKCCGCVVLMQIAQYCLQLLSSNFCRFLGIVCTSLASVSPGSQNNRVQGQLALPLSPLTFCLVWDWAAWVLQSQGFSQLAVAVSVIA